MDDTCRRVDTSFDGNHTRVYVCEPCYQHWLKNGRSWEAPVAEPSAKQLAVGLNCLFGRPECANVLNDRCGRVETGFDGKHAHVYVCRGCYKHWLKNGRSWEAPVAKPPAKQLAVGLNCLFGRPECANVLDANCGRIETSFDGKHAHVYVCGGCYQHWMKNGKSWEAPVAKPPAKQLAVGSLCSHGRPECTRFMDDTCKRVDTSFDGNHTRVYVCVPCYQHWLRNGKSWEAPVAEPSAKQLAVGLNCLFGRPECANVLNANCGRIETSFDGKHAHVYVCGGCYQHWMKNGKSWEAPVARRRA
jgi:hypothetical protein